MESVYERKPWLNLYPSGVPSELEIPLKSINDLFDEVTEKYKKRVAIRFYGKKISYKELRDKVDRFASALIDLGLKKGDRVALLLLNCPEHIIAFYATLKVGGVVTAISPVYVSSEIKHQLVDSGARILICQDFLYSTVEKTGFEFKHVILTNITDFLSTVKRLTGKSILRGVYQNMAALPAKIYDKENLHQFRDLLNRYHPNPSKVEIDPKEDIVSLPYTGGTTGKPKGVLITHYNAAVQVLQLSAFLSVLEEGKEVWISYMPFYHAAGQILSMLNGILQGYTLVVITSPEVDDILYYMMKYRAGSFIGAPAMYEMLKDYKKTDTVDWKALKVVLCGADALHESTANDWKIRTGTSICEGYGQTECVALTHINPIGNEKIGSVGIPLPSTSAAVLDPEKDEFVPLNEIGEIVISGPQVTSGYWQNTKATEECIAELGGTKWWRTGDLGRMDENGFFYIYDRKRDLIKYKGLRIFAREVEEVLRTHPKIKEAGVIGVPDIKVGQQVKATVVLESDSRGSISEADIIEYCKGKLAHYKIPRIIEFAGELARTDVGKVSRRELREEET